MKILYHAQNEKQEKNFEDHSTISFDTDTEVHLSIGCTVRGPKDISSKIDIELGLPCEYDSVIHSIDTMRAYLTQELFVHISKINDVDVPRAELILPKFKQADRDGKVLLSRGFGVTFPIGDFEFIRVYIKIKRWINPLEYESALKGKNGLEDILTTFIKTEESKLDSLKRNREGFVKWVYGSEIPDHIKNISFDKKVKFQEIQNPKDPGEFMLTFGKYGREKPTALRDIPIAELVEYHKWLRAQEKPSFKLQNAVNNINKYLALPENAKYLGETFGYVEETEPEFLKEEGIDEPPF